jgi:microcystin-dependent protein
MPGTPFTNLQPSLALTLVTPTAGVFPSGGGGGSATGDTLGFVYEFAGNFAPGGSDLTNGQTLSVNSNAVLDAIFGTTYGGDGVNTFLLPNLQGDVIIGQGGAYTEGVATSTPAISLTTANLPPSAGSDAAFDNIQPSLPLETLICVSGVFPSNGGGSGTAAFVGEIANFAGTYVPGGWALANGATLSIASNTALFSIIGTTYGGDGTTDFVLPNLVGQTAIGADAASPVGTVSGQAATSLTASELPPGGTPVPNLQPSVSVEYLIADSGIFPTDSAAFNATTPTLGQIVEFAGNFVPSGYLLANGATLSIASNSALFSVLGTTYGGDGTTSFALPDLDGRAVIGAGNGYTLGQDYGTASTELAADNIPACYARGTWIAVEGGECLVERLAAGDRVMTASGDLREIVWIGHRRIDCRRHRAPGKVWPVRVRAGAFGAGLPRRDLTLSPDHAVFAQGVLVPVKCLINGDSIRQVPCDTVTYYHIELAAHDILLAEGLPAESFLPGADRSGFGNGGGVIALHPEFNAWAWDVAACAPLVLTGPKLDAVRAMLARQAASEPALAVA